MREHPLLMKGPLVRATLEGRKTQTRRPVKMPSHGVEPYNPGYADGAFWNYSFTEIIARSPLGQTGDRLWVRETWAWPGEEEFIYRADQWAARIVAKWKTDPNYPQVKWSPLIHMPRRACRLVLPLVSVRVERVQDITEEDARAEGVEPIGGSYREGFREVWQSIYGTWDANPWVWVAEWKEIEVNK